MANYTEITDPVVLDSTGKTIAEAINRAAQSLQDIAESQRKLIPVHFPVHYGLKIDKSDSNPNTRMSYMYDCVGFTPARMDYTKGEFDYGSWGDAFFVKNNYPAMVSFDGMTEKKLDRDDQTKYEDGSASDIANVGFEGNAMSVFDGRIWIYLHEDSNYEYIEVSNTQLSSNYVAYGFMRADGTIADKCYFPMHTGYKDSDGRLRSIADQVMWYNTGGAQPEIDAASACGDHWYIGDYQHVIMLHSLLYLISCSDDLQGSFGQGRSSGYVNDASQHYGHLNTGTLKSYGQFFGYSDTTHEVKVFFIEKPWADRWDRCLGLINASGTVKYKLSPPYNLTGDGYASVADYTPPANGYQKDTRMGVFGRLPISTGGSASTYLCDYFYTNNSITAIALWGGDCSNGAVCGASFFSSSISFTPFYRPALSCRADS